MTTRHVDRDAREPRAGDAVAAGAGELPAVIDPAHVDGVDLPVALHRLADRRRPGRVDRPQPLAEVDLVGSSGMMSPGSTGGNAQRSPCLAAPPDLDGARRPSSSLSSDKSAGARQPRRG
jgi:hypothetical protein